MHKNAVFIVAQFNFHNAEVWFWWHWVLKGFTFANVLWREPIHLLPYFSRSSVSHRFPWLSGTFFTSLQCSTGGRSAKTICQAKKCHVKQKTKNHALHHQFNWNAWSCQLYQPDHLWSLLLFREKLSAATDINHEVRFSPTTTRLDKPARLSFRCSLDLLPIKQI